MFINVIANKIGPHFGGIESMGYFLGKEFTKDNEVRYYAGEVAEDILGSAKIVRNTKTFPFAVSVLKNHQIGNRKELDFCLSYQAALGSYLKRKLFKTPYIVLVHGNELYNDGRKSIKIKIREFLRRIILDNANVVYANSHFTKNLCMKCCNRRDIQIVYPGVAYKNFSDVQSEKYNLLSVGRLVKRKGFQNVILALSTLRNEYPEIKYHIVGIGEYEEELKELVKNNNLKDVVIFHGRVSEAEKNELYKKADLFVMPSFEIETEQSVEGFGIVYIEANMYGKYVIAARTGGVPDAIYEGVTGSLIDRSCPECIINAIEDYYNSYEVHQKSTLEIKKWAEKFDYSHAAMEYLKLLEEI